MNQTEESGTIRRVTIDDAIQSYARRANEYIDALGSIDALEASTRTTSLDRDLISTWAGKQRDGQILDVGCGPGHWTNWLHEQGIDIAGVDPTPEFIRHAQESYPDITFSPGRAEQLDVADSGLAGILAWYSLIHTPPDRITDALAEFGRSIEPGGGLLVGFFEGPEVLPFDHAITTAYFWPLDLLSRKVEEAGFTVTFRDTRVDHESRPHGAIAAHQPS